MKILFAFNQDLNPYVKVVMQGLIQEKHPIDSGTENFWNAKHFDYDIVHIQWPETLFDWRVPSSIELLFLRQRLKEIKQTAKIVYTRHNEVSHHANESNKGILKELYEILESECDAMIHLGETSRTACLQIANLCNKTHVVIPIPIYDELYAPFMRISQNEAKRRLGIPLNRKVVLAFGNFRYEEEKQLLVRTFSTIINAHASLFAPKWHKPRDYSFSPLHPMLCLRTLRKAAWGWWRQMDLRANKTMTDEDVALCFIASDVVFIQRLDDLNSGNIPMAFLFKKVVAGPETGNIGETLKLTGNPVFAPRIPSSVEHALKHAIELSTSSLGEQNFRHGITHWSSRQIASAHAAFYRSLLS